MKIKDFMRNLYNFTDPLTEHYRKTCDNLKAGDPEQELGKIATAMFPTPEVIRAAAEWGANLLIVHEPTFYDHWDDPAELDKQTGIRREIIDLKRNLIAASGLTIYRYHDHPHYCETDVIGAGEIQYAGLEGTWSKGKSFAHNAFELKNPQTALDLARLLEKKLNIRHIRICGAPDTLCRRLSLCFGAAGILDEEIAEYDAVLTGEVSEWATSEFVRDFVALTGKKKALLVMGHIGSERDGMKLLVEMIRQRHPALEVRYFEGGETYSYTD